MPELPEVETVRRGLEPAMTGARITRVEQRRADLRFPFPERFVKRLTGATVSSLTRRAKYLIANLDSGEALIMHLGMSGRFMVAGPQGDIGRPGEFYVEESRHPRHDHVVFHLSSGFVITYNDVRRFGFMDLVPQAGIEQSKHFRSMGIEPLGNALHGEAIAELFAGKHTPLKAALLDQSLIAGLGNIYVCEALHRASLSPLRLAGTIVGEGGQATRETDRLARVVRDVLEEAVEAGGSTLRDYAQTDGSLGYFQHRFRVYDRKDEPCPTPGCGGIIQRTVQSGRSTFHCVICQN